MTNHDTGLATPHSGRQLALTIAATAAILLLSAFLWFGAGYKAANDCKEGTFNIPQVEGGEMTSEGCRISIDGRLSDPLPDRDSDLALAALITSALACVPPYLLIISRRRQKR